MNQMFGEAQFGLTKYGKKCIVYDSQLYPGFKYTFSLKSKARRNDGASTWKCVECDKLKVNGNHPQHKVATIRLRPDNILLNSPDHPSHPHFCDPLPATLLEVAQLDRQMREQIKQNGKRPRRAHESALATITRVHADDHLHRAEVEQNFPTFTTARSGLYRAYNQRYPIIPSVYDIPEHLKMTLSGANSLDAMDPLHREVYVIYEAPVGTDPFIIFASRLDMSTLRESSHVVCDGTFTYCPTGFAQLYVVLGFRGGEAVPVVHALMPDRTAASYARLFQALFNRLVQDHNGVGQLATATFHLDFESAAMSAVREVFPNCAIKGCLFHYCQALQRNVQKNGLQILYQQRDGFHLPQFEPFRTWIRRLVALSLLPLQLVPGAWHRILSHLPLTGDAALDANITRFREYYETYWLHPNRLPLFNHSDQNGPRTTNHAEGYNSSLAAKFESPHPRLAVFLVTFQEVHNAKQIRQRALIAGAAPVPQNVNYAENNNSIRQALQHLTNVWATLAATLQGNDFSQAMDGELIRFLDHVQHCLM